MLSSSGQGSGVPDTARAALPPVPQPHASPLLHFIHPVDGKRDPAPQLGCTLSRYSENPLPAPGHPGIQASPRELQLYGAYETPQRPAPWAPCWPTAQPAAGSAQPPEACPQAIAEPGGGVTLSKAAHPQSPHLPAQAVDCPGDPSGGDAWAEALAGAGDSPRRTRVSQGRRIRWREQGAAAPLAQPGAAPRAHAEESGPGGAARREFLPPCGLQESSCKRRGRGPWDGPGRAAPGGDCGGQARRPV